MNLLENALYQADMEKSLLQVLHAEKLQNAKVLVTGATGLVCSAIVDLLLAANRNITVYAAGRSAEKVKARFGDRVIYVPYDATKPLQFHETVDFIIHGASNASPNLYVNEPVETMQGNVFGMQNLLDYARKTAVKKVIYVSSSEVYGKKDSAEPFTEDQFGYVDLLNPRSSYAVSKRAAETMCVSYRAEYGVPFNIVRLGHIYGPSATPTDGRISSAFARQAAAGETLVMKSEGKQLRSYCYSPDCASAVLSVLTSGEDGEAYNISNRDSVISIRQMAEYLAKAGHVKLQTELPTEAEKRAFNPMDNSSLNSEKLEAIGWRGVFDAETGLSHTVKILRECMKN